MRTDVDPKRVSIILLLACERLTGLNARTLPNQGEKISVFLCYDALSQIDSTGLQSCCTVGTWGSWFDPHIVPYYVQVPRSLTHAFRTCKVIFQDLWIREKQRNLESHSHISRNPWEAVLAPFPYRKHAPCHQSALRGGGKGLIASSGLGSYGRKCVGSSPPLKTTDKYDRQTNRGYWWWWPWAATAATAAAGTLYDNKRNSWSGGWMLCVYMCRWIRHLQGRLLSSLFTNLHDSLRPPRFIAISSSGCHTPYDDDWIIVCFAQRLAPFSSHSGGRNRCSWFAYVIHDDQSNLMPRFRSRNRAAKTLYKLPIIYLQKDGGSEKGSCPGRRKKRLLDSGPLV